jgi:DNA-directed RNA polymerase subunit N (RpoN/RPB10)
VIKCFMCGKVRQNSYECLDKKKEEGEAHISEAQRHNVQERMLKAEDR